MQVKTASARCSVPSHSEVLSASSLLQHVVHVHFPKWSPLGAIHDEAQK